MNIYQEQILDNYKNPQNYGKADWVPTHSMRLENLSCGDILTFYLLVENEIVKDIRFEGEGCSIAIGTASMLSQELKGKDINFIQNFEFKDVLKLIGIELTTSRQRCASLSLDAVQKAIKA